jgi:coenzyme F420 hydrogenase subunit beta
VGGKSVQTQDIALHAFGPFGDLMQTNPDIFDLVNLDLCVGCGACIGVCPTQKLGIHTNQYGELRPTLTSRQCKSSCGKCTTVCPVCGVNPNEDALARGLFENFEGTWSDKAGFIHKTLVGYRNDHQRAQCASGGLASWMLEELFNASLIDHAVCVVPTGIAEQLFAYTVLGNSEDVWHSSGSAYYPVEMSEVISFMLANPGSYAVTGLPCFVKALRLAQKTNSLLQERIKFVLGLTCGQIKSKHYTAYLAACAGLAGQPQYVSYRGKSADKRADNSFFSCRNDLNSGRNLFWQEEPTYAWTNRWFTPQACDFCDDVFAELADATFMDAWLPEYICDSGGTNLVVIRNPTIAEILEQGVVQQAITGAPIALQKIIQSQAGVVEYKRKQLGRRLNLADSSVGEVICKRVKPALIVPPLARLQIKNIETMRITSRNALIYNKEGSIDLDFFNARMANLVNNKVIIDRFDRFSIFFMRLIKYIFWIGRQK